MTGADGVQHPGKLNPMESVKFARLALSHGKGELLQTWLSRLEASEELGDILIQFQTPDMCVWQRPWARKIADRLPAVTTACALPAENGGGRKSVSHTRRGQHALANMLPLITKLRFCWRVCVCGYHCKKRKESWEENTGRRVSVGAAVVASTEGSGTDARNVGAAVYARSMKGAGNYPRSVTPFRA